MGLAASQARFLGITLRKANCEFESTRLAQQKLELTDQMTDVSQEYANAMNSTKLVWNNDAVTASYGLTYNLLMMPSAANDYNPYMVSTKSGAIVLDSKYSAAAKAAGISMAGGTPSQEGRDAFLKALASPTTTTDENGKTIKTTYDNVISNDTYSTLTSGAQNVKWHYSAGLGATPRNKGVSDGEDLSALIADKDVGQQKLDWDNILISELANGNSTFNENINWVSTADSSVSSAGNLAGTYDTSIRFGSVFQTTSRSIGTGSYSVTNPTDGTKNYGQLTLINNGIINYSESNLKNMTLGNLLNQDIVLMTTTTADTKDSTGKVAGKGQNALETISDAANALLDSIYEVFRAKLGIDTESKAALEQALDMTKRNITATGTAYKDCGTNRDLSDLSKNDAYQYAGRFNRICVTDNGDDKNKQSAAINLSNMVSAFLTYYDNALNGYSSSNYNVGRALDNETENTTKNYFVTDDPNYVYITKSSDNISTEEKTADFWNELYNNICVHGWRYDDSVLKSDYLESAIKDGRYSLMALNNDGYFYQQRYNDINYLQEETDNDAISRAEAKYTQKKAEITAKEDSIDIKSKKLDSEIAELTTEISSVQNLISKSIEKTFSMFSS